MCSIILQRDILSCAEHLDQLEEDLGTRMASLKEIVQSKTAVPTSQVYVSCAVVGEGVTLASHYTLSTLCICARTCTGVLRIPLM